jgi:hypothetical protein
MKPDVDWVKFHYLMEGQCEPEFSEYEVTETRVRLADIDPDLWHEVEMTGTLRAYGNTEDREREVSWTVTEADMARTMSGWRVTQQESELKFPCYPSDVKRWAEEQLLEVGQDLEDACNDELRERLTERATADQKLNREERETHKKSCLQERAIMDEIKRRGLDPHGLHWYPGRKGDKYHIQDAMLKDPSLFTDKSFEKAWETLSDKGLIRNSRAALLSP